MLNGTLNGFMQKIEMDSVLDLHQPTMESAIFYNTFFNVPKVLPKIVPVMEAIQSLPDDVLSCISKFLDAKEIVAKERFQRLTIAQEKYNARSTNDWIRKWQQGQHFLPPLVKVCSKIIKYNDWTHNNVKICNLKKEEVLAFCLHKARVVDRLRSSCAYYSRPKPFYLGQRYTDLAGNQVVSVWRQHSDADGFYYGSTIVEHHLPAPFAQRYSINVVSGCERMELVWRIQRNL